MSIFHIFVNFSLYTSGLNPDVQALYPKIEFPVSRGTPSIQGIFLWNHVESWVPFIIVEHTTVSRHI